MVVGGGVYGYTELVEFLAGYCRYWSLLLLAWSGGGGWDVVGGWSLLLHLHLLLLLGDLLRCDAAGVVTYWWRFLHQTWAGRIASLV